MIPAIGSALPRLDATSLSPTGASASIRPAMAGAAPSDFGAMLAQVASDAVSTMKTAEASSIQGVKGQASTQAVVEAVMAAERTLQSAVAIRDKAVTAYLELSRMAI